MLFLLRPRQTYMPFAVPRERTQQDVYNRQLQDAYASTRRVAPHAPAPPGAATRDPFADLKELAAAPRVGRARPTTEFATAKAKVLDATGRLDVTANAARAAILARALHASVDGDDRASSPTLYTDDVRAWTPALSTSSLRELIAEFDRRDDAFSEIELEVAPLDVGGDYACAEWSVTMTHTGPLAVAGGMIVEPTGVRITLHGVTVAEFRGDRICALRQYWDELARLRPARLAGPMAGPSNT